MEDFLFRQVMFEMLMGYQPLAESWWPLYFQLLEGLVNQAISDFHKKSMRDTHIFAWVLWNLSFDMWKTYGVNAFVAFVGL